jgi:hypothetical protein
LYLKTQSLIPCLIAHALANSEHFIVVDILQLDIPGYTGAIDNIVEFQPAWFNLLGFIIFAIGITWLSRVLRKPL